MRHGVTSRMNIAIAALMPHPPILIPAVGKERLANVKSSLDSMREISREILAANPETVVLISPHSPRSPYAFGVWTCAELHGTFAPFNAPDAGVSLPVDGGFVQALAQVGPRAGVQFSAIAGGHLDHGAAVPLWFLMEAGWKGPTVVIALNTPGAGGLHGLGRAIALAAETLGRRIAIVASGDMSHRLIPGAPAGFEPTAKEFDARFIELLRAKAYRDIERIPAALQARAAEDVVDSTAVALAATGWKTGSGRVLSYEGPFGVGYGVAVLYSAAEDRSHEYCDGTDLPRLARTAVESVLARRNDEPPPPNGGYLAQRAGVFVTIKTSGGKLRGCIGTLEQPQAANIVEETWRNAIGAAFSDHRFPPVTGVEMHNLRFEVSVLHSFETVDSPQLLEPAEWGVIVRTADGRRATLLPALNGIDTAEQQFRAVCEKGGIAPGEAVTITRYRVDKFKEPGCPD